MSYEDLEMKTKLVQEAKRIRELLSLITDKEYKGKLKKYFYLLCKVGVQRDYILKNKEDVKNKIIQIRRNFPEPGIKSYTDLINHFCDYRSLAISFFERGEIDSAHRKLLVLHASLRPFHIPDTSLLEYLQI